MHRRLALILVAAIKLTGSADAAIVINEVDSDTSGTDNAEFIELFSTTGPTPLDGLVVVLFNGNGDISYAVFDLDGYHTDAFGYFLIGNVSVPSADLAIALNTLQNGADAIALFQGNATSFPNGISATTTNLLDAVVYGTDDPASRDSRSGGNSKQPIRSASSVYAACVTA